MRQKIRKQKIRPKTILLLCLISMTAAVSAGCGKKIEIRVQDMYTQTRMTAPEGATVQDILTEAEIDIQEGDEVWPSLDTRITEDQGKISISRHAKAQLAVDDEVMDIEMTGGKVKDALNQLQITLGEHDCIDHEPEAYVTDGMKISVIRRLAVYIAADGETKDYLTEAKTVEELLNLQGVTLGKRDIVEPKLPKKLEEGTKVVVKRVDVKEVTEKEPIAYQTRTEKSKSMTIGTSKVTRQGVNGEKKITYQVTYVDGKEDGRKAVKEEVIKEPVDKIITQGTKPKPKPAASKGKSKSGKGKKVVSKKKVYDCDGSGHGYYIIKYSDGSIKYKDF